MVSSLYFYLNLNNVSSPIQTNSQSLINESSDQRSVNNNNSQVAVRPNLFSLVGMQDNYVISVLETSMINFNGDL